MNATATQYPEAHDDPMMQGFYEQEKAWGLPHASFDSYMLHSVHGAGDIKKALQLESGDDPFAWGDDEIHNAASTALLTLRNKKNPSDTEFAQLCWLEMSLFGQVSFCIAPHFDEATEERLLGKYRHLIDDAQLELARQEDDTFFDEIDEMFSADQPLSLVDKSGLALLDNSLERIQAKVAEVVDFVGSDEHNEEECKSRQRVLEYLNSIS